ncbi:hypothetical protein J2Z31_001955 [Sinorhizobium kostiense]|uniref:Uncharacterized protein n=1 Tax=Sinorhizobium kostiense TaxID=76747 RepID=A0ABS4QXT9_9HYPH|nr:hypothetical protein [Sinorhizobium kostiense]
MVTGYCPDGEAVALLRPQPPAFPNAATAGNVPESAWHVSNPQAHAANSLLPFCWKGWL